MSYTTLLILQTCALAIVIAQPVFGWSSIPRFFNYSGLSAVLLGIADTAIMLAPILAYTLTQ